MELKVQLSQILWSLPNQRELSHFVSLCCFVSLCIVLHLFVVLCLFVVILHLFVVVLHFFVVLCLFAVVEIGSPHVLIKNVSLSC